MNTVTELRRRMASIARWTKVLEDGLNGRPHSLGDGEGRAFSKRMSELGIELYSKSRAQKEGLSPKRGAKPVVTRYFSAPIQKDIGLYVLEQLTPNAKLTRGAEADEEGSAG
jgi:hypothetical protein